MVTRADVMLQINAPNIIVDNAWLWHADHDDCGTASNKCYSSHGLEVTGDGVNTYGLAVEHTFGDLVAWNGNNGSTYFLQQELPYADPAFGQQGHVGFAVGESVEGHFGVGLGVYIIGGGLQMSSAFSLPAAQRVGNRFEHMMTLVIGGVPTQFNDTVCRSVGQANRSKQDDVDNDCIPPDTCFGAGCYLYLYPRAPLPSTCSVGSDAFLPGVPGQDAGGGPTQDKDQCAQKCVAAATSSGQDQWPCRFWKFGSNGNWCQLFRTDGVAGTGWPIPNAGNTSESIVFSGTIPGNGC
jgi:hypothetical protein